MSLPVRPNLQYVEDVRAIISLPPYGAPAGFLDSWHGDRFQRDRCEMHRQMGLTPEQSAEELRPFIEAALKPLYREPSFRETMAACRAMIAKIESK